MRLSDFILLDVEDKKLAVLHEGVLIGKRNLNDTMIFLFQIENYYVETYCNFKSKGIDEYRTFDNIKFLSPYLETISLEELLN